MNTSPTLFVLLLLLGALYLPIIFFAMQRRDDGHGASIWLAASFALIAMVLNVAEAIEASKGSALPFQEIQIYVAFTLITILMLAFQTFMKHENWWIWVGVWILWMLGLALILTNALKLPDVLWSNGTLTLQRERLGPAWAILGWLIISISLVLAISNENKQARQQLFRNRLNYWWPTVFLLFINDVLLFSNTFIAGQPLRLMAAVLMAYVIGTHNVPDLKQIFRRLLAYALISIVIVGVYAAGYLLLQAVFGTSKNFNPLLAGAFIALLLTLMFAPMLNLVSRAVNNWVKGDQYNPSHTIHKYSESISNILDMDRLASIAVGIILEAMQIERGFLFLVDSDREADGHKTYRLRSARSPEERQMIAVELDENGIIASYFIREQKPLLQYDLDLLPVFRSASPFERDWFNQLHTEVYIPIFAKKQWIGLLAFGPKLSRNRYTNEDLVTLGSHANQTAVALENARLVDNLMRLNNELRQARRALEKNNRDLERIDQAKSDFISIASHELRTPLTVIKGYTEMLLEDTNLDPNFKQIMNSIHDGTIRLHEVMDSMFDIAQIDARSLKPHIQPVELGHLIQEICIEQASSIKERKQSLTIDLPNLPHVKSDPNLLRKLFHHLIRNAVKFTPNNGKITVTGHSIPAIIDLPNGGLEIVIADTGVGVDPNFREIIFTKFYQPGELGKHSTSKTRFKGSGAGLGLALAKGIVEAHGGRIYVESPGYDEINFPGSQFHVILPLSKLEDGEEQKTSSPVKFQV
ncbi:MAG: GAF domain-containing protein [Anaerolineales bacterium]|uniref:GAF domain-containing sensor histidine kinase n=1 Tax=Candidatus Villigracilis affinis TaxID=3140682 RepID=UPI001D80387A|nr:GAF domain-containing protein [Anaerolineales bacterium]MBK9601453.1 GAF domain-containing protein [Anaerolineales bacterium]MBL0344998.1 GAF domain-containing protein [Anaerolineales bacterium]